MPKDFQRLTNSRYLVEYKHNTLPLVIVAEHGSKAASSSDFPWQATANHALTVPKQVATTGYCCQAQNE